LSETLTLRTTTGAVHPRCINARLADDATFRKIVSEADATLEEAERLVVDPILPDVRATVAPDSTAAMTDSA
jgi:hypothetical protein